MIVGATLVIANAPIGAESWTDQRTLLIRFGVLVISLGIVGLVAEVVVVLASLRGDPPPAPQAQATVALPDNEELTRAKARVEELEAQDDAEQRRMFGSALADQVARAREIRADYAGPSETFHGRQDASDAWARALGWNDDITRMIRLGVPDGPELAAEFNEPIEPMATTDADWRTNIATYMETKAQRLHKIAQRLHG
jgi:hypothetical protein